MPGDGIDEINAGTWHLAWVEQQGKTVEELHAQWDDPGYWTSRYHAWQDLDDRIRDFNDRVGLVGRK